MVKRDVRDLRVLLPLPILGVFGLCLYGFTTTFATVEQSARPTLRAVYAGGIIMSALLLTLVLAASIRADNEQRPRLER